MEVLQQKRELDREVQNKILFMAFIITKFARAYKMSKPDAYRYLKKYGGIDFLDECWWALHIDNPYWAVKDLYKVCRNNGGLR
ncbi:MAG: DUF3791 domain-containing protein [Prevotellaceae bacterium]|jgi:hypothetical protein|nr:DUF3791 domain-containing protein [Prevotellaceae bacterium]